MKRSSVRRLLHIMMLLTLLLLIPPDDLSSAQSVNRIFTVAWNPDGTVLAVGGTLADEPGIWLYDPNGQLITHLSSPDNIISITWSPDGSKIAAYANKTYYVWDINTGNVLLSFEQPYSTEDSFVYWSPDGNRFVTVYGRSLLVRDSLTGDILTPLFISDPTHAIRSVALSLDGTKLFTSSTDNVVRVWDVATATVTQEFSQEPGVTSMDMSPDGTRLAIGNHDGQVRIIDSETGERLSTLPGAFTTEGGSQIMYVQWHPDGNRLAGASFDRITIWDTTTGQTLNVLIQVENSVPRAMDYSPDGQLAYVGEGGTIVITPAGEDGDDDQTIIDATASSPTPSPTQLPVNRIWTVAWSPDGTMLAKGGIVADEPGIWLYDANGQFIKRLDAIGNVPALSWSPDGTRIAARTGSDSYYIYNVDTGTVSHSFEQLFEGDVFFPYWSPDGSRIATVGGRNVFVRDAATGDILSTLISPGSVPDSVYSVVWSLDGTQLFTISTDDVVRVWDVATATVIQEFPQEPGVTSMDMSPDGTRLAIGNHDGQVRIIDSETGERLSTLSGAFTTEGGSQIMYVQWHPDGNRLAGASFDRITIWDTSTGQTLNVLTQVENSVPQAMDYSPDGQLAYVGEGATIVITPTGEDGDDDQIIIDATASSPTPSPTQLPVNRIWTVAWSPDGTILAKGGYVSDMTGIWLYDANGQLIQQFDTPGNVLSITWSPDDSDIVALGKIDLYEIYNVNTGAVVLSIDQIEATDDFFAYWSPDGSRIATVGGRDVYVRDAATGDILSTLISPGSVPDSVYSVVWSLDGTQLFTVSLDDVVRVWDVDTATVIQEFPQEPGVTSMDMSPDGTRLAIGNHDGQVRIIDAETGERLSTLSGAFTTEGGSQIMYVQWHPDGNRLAGASFDRITIWDTSTGQTLNVLTQVENSVPQAMDYSPDGQLAYVGEGATIVITPAGEDGDDDQTIIDATASSPTPSPATTHQSQSYAQQEEYVAVQWHPTEDIIAVSDGYQLSVYTADFQLVERVDLIDSAATIYRYQILWSPDGSKIAVSLSASTDVLHTDSGRVLQMWAWHTGTLQKAYEIPDIHTDPSVAWSPDSLRFAAVPLLTEPNIHVTIFDASNGQPISDLGQQLASFPAQLAWSPDGNQIAFDSQGLQIWDVNNQQYIGTVTAEFRSTVDLAFGPTDNLIALVDLDSYNDIKIWDTGSFELIRTLQGHTDNVRQFSWGTGGIISVGLDGTTRVWDPATGQQLAVIQTGVTGLPSWNPTGTQWVAGEPDGKIRIREAASGLVLVEFDPVTETVLFAPTANAGPDQPLTDSDANSTEHFALIAWSPSGDKIATLTEIGDVLGENDIVGIYDSETMQLIATIPNPQDTEPFNYEGISWSRDGTKVAVARQVSGRTAIQVWDVSSMPFQIVLDYHDQITASGFGTALAWRPGFNQLAYSDNYKVNLLDVETGTVIQTYEGNNVYSTDEIAWSPDGAYLLASSLPGLLFNGATGALISTVQEDNHFGPIVWSPDGTRFLAQYGDVYRIWSLDPLEPINQLPGDIGFSRDVEWRGNTIAASQHTTNGVAIIVWDSESLEIVNTIPISGPLFDMSLSPDGSHIVYSENGNLVQRAFQLPTPAPTNP